MKRTESIDQYIADFIQPTQVFLEQMRKTIRKAAPEAAEKISYGIPTFTLNKKNLVHFGGYEHHIGFYPGSAAIEHFTQEISPYESSKGTVQFPLDQPLPLALVTKIVKFRVKAEAERAKTKNKK